MLGEIFTQVVKLTEFTGKDGEVDPEVLVMKVLAAGIIIMMVAPSHPNSYFHNLAFANIKDFIQVCEWNFKNFESIKTKGGDDSLGRNTYTYIQQIFMGLIILIQMSMIIVKFLIGRAEYFKLKSSLKAQEKNILGAKLTYNQAKLAPDTIKVIGDWQGKYMVNEKSADGLTFTNQQLLLSGIVVDEPTLSTSKLYMFFLYLFRAGRSLAIYALICYLGSIDPTTPVDMLVWILSMEDTRYEMRTGWFALSGSCKVTYQMFEGGEAQGKWLETTQYVQWSRAKSLLSYPVINSILIFFACDILYNLSILILSTVPSVVPDEAA